MLSGRRIQINESMIIILLAVGQVDIGHEGV